MDKNKLEKLRSIEYRMVKCCGMCKCGQFGPDSLWGTCTLHIYDHLKHSGPRQMSIHIFGGCDSYEPGDYPLGDWDEFKDHTFVMKWKKLCCKHSKNHPECPGVECCKHGKNHPECPYSSRS